MRPQELDVPHWARATVKRTRERLGLDPKLTDRMIYAALLRPLTEKEQDAALKALEMEVLS